MKRLFIKLQAGIRLSAVSQGPIRWDKINRDGPRPDRMGDGVDKQMDRPSFQGALCFLSLFKKNSSVECADRPRFARQPGTPPSVRTTMDRDGGLGGHRGTMAIGW